MYPKIRFGFVICGLFCSVLLVNGVAAQRKPARPGKPQTKPSPRQNEQPTTETKIPGRQPVVKDPYSWAPIFLGSDTEFITDRADNYLYAKDSHALYRSSDFGKSWAVVFEPPELKLKTPEYFNCDSSPSLIFKQSKSNPQTMYIASQGDICRGMLANSWKRNSDIWRSVDGGKSWSNMTNGSLEKRIISLDVSPTNPDAIFFTLLRSNRGVGNVHDVALLKSPNGGKNSAVITPDGVEGYLYLTVSVNPFDGNNIILVDGSSTPKETNNGGISWHTMEYDMELAGSEGGGKSKGDWASMLFHPTDAGIRAGRITTGNGNWHLVVSRDNGRSWKDVTPKSGGYDWRNGYRVERPRYQWISSVVFSQNEKEKLYAGNESGLFVSANLGQTWKRVSSEGAYSTVESNDGKNVNISTHFGIFQSDTDFIKWAIIGQGLSAGDSLMADNENRIYPAGSFSEHLYLIKPEGDLIRTINANDWVFEKNFADDMSSKTVKGYGPLRIDQIFITTDSVAFLTLQRKDSHVNRIFKIALTSGAKSEVPLPKEVIYVQDSCQCRLALSPNDSSKLYLYSEKQLFVSNDGGNTWAESLNSGVDFVAVSPKNPNQAYAILKASPNALNSVVSTTDGGKTWYAGSTALSDIAINLQITTPFRAVAVDVNNPNSVYVTSKNGLFNSTDGGQTWNLVASSTNFGGEIYGVEVNQVSGNELFLTSKSGIWNSKDSGKTWGIFNNGISTGEPVYKVISSKSFTIAVGDRKIYRLLR